MAPTESTLAKTTRPLGHDGFSLKDLSRPYRLASYGSAPHATRPVRVSDTRTIGGAAITVIAGPCSVESARCSRHADASKHRRDDAARRRVQAALVARTRSRDWAREALRLLAEARADEDCRSSPR